MVSQGENEGEFFIIILKFVDFLIFFSIVEPGIFGLDVDHVDAGPLNNCESHALKSKLI